MMASVGSPSMNLVQQGLAVSVENLNDDTLVLIFETGLYNGCPVPCVEWHAQQLVDVYGCANFLLISFPSLNDREFPTKVNNIVGNNCNAKKNTTTSPEHHITRRVKYYRGQENSTTVSIRLYKIMSTILNDIKYVYHYQIKRTQDRYAATVVQQQVMNNVTSNPTQFIAPREPQISSVVPNRLMYQAGKRQTIDVSGQDLYTASGFLYPQNLTNFVESSCIVLSVFTTSGFNEMILRFYHPDILVDRFYYPVLKVGETWRTFPNCLIEFAVQPIMAGEDLTPYGLQFSSDLPDEMYPSYDGINAMSLTDTIVYGAPHTLASLTKLYPEGIPFLTTKSSKDESAPDRSLIDLAISDGELTTMLYLVVWELETKGVFSNAVRSKLDEYLAQSKNVTYEVMLDAIKGEEDDASYEGSETRIRDFVKLLAPAQKNIIPKQPSMLTMNFNPASPTAFVVAHSQMDSVETYFTDTETPVHLIDPITGVIYKCPVVLPSGKTVSIQIAEFKPRFDIFTNKPFEPDQRIVPNRHLQECVDEYIGEKVKTVLKGSITNLEKFKQTLYILLLLIEREDLNSATLAKHFFIKQYWSKFLLSLPFLKSLTNNEKQTLFTILTRGSFPKEQYTAWVLEDKPTEEISSLFALFPSPNDLYCALELRLALKENDHTKRITAIKLILKYYKVTQVNLLPLFLQQEQDLSSTLSVLHTASERLDRSDFSILVTDLPLDKALLDVLNAPDLTPNQAIKIAEHKFFAAKARQEVEELSSTLTKTLQEKQQIQQEHQQSHQQLMDQIHQLQSENAQLNQKNAFLMKEIEQFDTKQKQVQRQLEQILVCGQRFCVEGSTYMANCDGSCRLGQVWGSNPYTNSSHLCTAAKHAGKIPASGGSFTFKIAHGRPSYAASTQNGVTTLTHNMYNTSIKM